MTTDQIISAVIILASYFFGFKYMRIKNQNDELAAKVEELELNEREEQNKKDLDAIYSGRSDEDVLNEAIERGRTNSKP
jgi:hypothetical protein